MLNPLPGGGQVYPLLPYLLILYAEDTPGLIAWYNQAHRCTSIVMEWVFGQLQIHLWCLRLTGGHLMKGPEKVFQVVALCTMLPCREALQCNMPLMLVGIARARMHQCHCQRRRCGVLHNTSMASWCRNSLL